MSENNEIEKAEIVEETTPHLSINKTPEEMFKDWFEDEGNKGMLSEMANELKKKFGDKNEGWFDLQKMITFTRFKKLEECLQILNLLKLGGLLVAQIKGKKEVYKIVMNSDSKLRVLQNLKRLKEKELKEIDYEILKLQINS